MLLSLLISKVDISILPLYLFAIEGHASSFWAPIRPGSVFWQLSSYLWRDKCPVLSNLAASFSIHFFNRFLFKRFQVSLRNPAGASTVLVSSELYVGVLHIGRLLNRGLFRLLSHISRDFSGNCEIEAFLLLPF